jgi:hypothetical protein
MPLPKRGREETNAGPKGGWGTTASLGTTVVTKVSTARRLAARIARLHVVASPLPPSGGFFLVLTKPAGDWNRRAWEKSWT